MEVFKRTLSILVTGIGIFICLYMSVLTLLGWFNLAAPITVICVILFLRSLLLGRPKHLKIIYLSLMLIFFVLASYRNFENKYYNRYEAVGDGEINLLQYSPFSEGTKATKLDKPATLKFTPDDELPRLDGATALYPLYAAFAQAVYPKDNYALETDEYRKQYGNMTSSVSCTATIHAYQNLIYGNADIIFVAGPSKEQLERVKDKDFELVFTPIGKEAFVFFVHSKNKVDSLTTEQIQKIYTKDILNWKQVGGNLHFIRAYQRIKDSGSQTAFVNFMDGKTPAVPPRKDKFDGMGGIIKEAASYRNHGNAIGYSFLFFVTEMVQNNNIKLIAVDGVKPTRENVKNGTYPLSAEFFAVTRSDNKNPNVDKFIKWILSPQGQELIEKTGYTPLNSKE